MKKIILGLFLLLGAISFAVPKYVNTTKLQNAGYEITGDDEDLFSFGKSTKEAGISVAFYPAPNQSVTSKAIFKDGEIYTYNFVPKNQKIKACHISVLYMTDKDLSGANLDKAVNSVLNEAESFLK